MSYLNTVPLVWGFLHGPQQHSVELLFRVPAECADLVASGGADIGIVPAFELLRQKLSVVPGVGIASRGPVRSILLVTKVPIERVRTVAADWSSRTSVALARIWLSRAFGVVPEVIPQAPDLPSMLATADAALIIGDPALRVNPEALGCAVYDLGEQWTAMTGLPMVFAVWAGVPHSITPDIVEAFQRSYSFGREHIEELVAAESAARGFAPELVRRYLTRHIVHEIGSAEEEGLQLFLEYASQLPGALNRAPQETDHPVTR